MRRLLSTACALLVTAGLLGADAPDKPLDIYFIDVMGGAATLIVTPERQSMLVDCGWPGFGDRDAKRIEHVIKDLAKLDHLDYLVTSHWHLDHFGGAENLAKRVRIDHYLDRGLPNPDAPDNDRGLFPDGPGPKDPLGIAYRKLTEGKRTTLKAGDKLPLKGSVDGLVVAASGKVLDAPESSKPNPACEDVPADHPVDKSDNALSLAFRLRLGKFEFFDAGDLTWNIEKKLVCPVDLVGPVDLYQVTHHGMDISNHPTLLATLAPTVSIMNNGPRKGGAAATVARLKALPSLKAAYQLHKNAATKPEQNTDPALIANRSTAGGEFIHVSVAPDGSKYTVQIGADGASQTFSSK